MAASLVFDWLHRLNSYIDGNRDRRSLIVINNCSAHGKKYNLRNVSFVQVEILLPNTISKLQLCNAIIIDALNTGFRRLQMKWVLDLIGVSLQKLYRLEQLTATR